MEKVFNENKKQNFNEQLNKENKEIAVKQCEFHDGGMIDCTTSEKTAISYNIDNYSPNYSNIDGTSKLDFQYRNTDVFPLKIQDKAYSKKYFSDCGVPEENLPKEYGVYKSYKDFEKDINKFKDKDIVIKYNCGADCNQVIRIKKGEIDKKKDKIIELFNENGGLNYVTGGHLKGAAKRLFVVQEDIAPGNENFPDDFKFWCINGKPAFCEVMTGRKSDLKCAFIDLTGKRMPLWHKFKGNMSDDELNKILNKLTDKQFDKMKELCEKVSKDIPLIRTDFCLGSDGEPKVIEAQELYMFHLNNITFNEKSISRNSWRIETITKGGKKYMKWIPNHKEVIDDEYKKNMEQVARTLGLKTGKYLTEPIYDSKTKKFDRKVFPFNKMIGNLMDLTSTTKHIDNTDGPTETNKAKQSIEKLKTQQNALSKISNTVFKFGFEKAFSQIYKKDKNMDLKKDIAEAINQHLGKPKNKQKELYWDRKGKDKKLMNTRFFLKENAGYIRKINNYYDEMCKQGKQNNQEELQNLKSFVEKLNEKEMSGCCPF